MSRVACYVPVSPKEHAARAADRCRRYTARRFKQGVLVNPFHNNSVLRA